MADSCHLLACWVSPVTESKSTDYLPHGCAYGDLRGLKWGIRVVGPLVLWTFETRQSTRQVPFLLLQSLNLCQLWRCRTPASFSSQKFSPWTFPHDSNSGTGAALHFVANVYIIQLHFRTIGLVWLNGRVNV